MMGRTDDRIASDATPTAWPRIVATAVAIAVAAGVAALLAVRYVASERQQDLREWQARLALVADSRAGAVADWLAAQTLNVGRLAENVSIQLYLTQLAQAAGDRALVTDQEAQLGYLRNLLLVEADRTGFAGVAVGPRVDANVPRTGTGGMAVLDPAGATVLATPDLPPLPGRLAELAAAAQRSRERGRLDLYPGPRGGPTLAFAAPVFGVQADPGSAPVGVVIAVKDVSAELFPLLMRPPLAEKSAESLLVQRAGAVVEYLSPLLDGTRPLEKRMPADTPDLAEAYALATPGGFALRRDYRGREVLVTGRAIAAAPWALVHKVDRAEALADSDARLDRLLVALLLVVALVAVGLVAVWRHGASRRADEAASRYRALAARFERQSDLLRLVTDSQPAEIFIADAEGHVRFANAAVGRRAGAAPADLAGKALAAVLGPAEARRHAGNLREAMASRQPSAIVQREGGERGRMVKTEYVPLEPGAGESARALVVETDITDTVAARERNARVLRELVNTLTAILDRRDPYSAHHSIRVAAVARRVAEEMALDPRLAETAELAGNLVNLGKVLVPPELLTKTGELSEDERARIRESIEAGAKLVERIEFDGPVVETLRQMQERWDGTGRPAGRKGEEILVTARVVAVANQFVALVSDRAWRKGLALDAALDTLFAESGTQLDRRVVSALSGFLDNHGGRAWWSEFVGASAA